jgi:aryl-alcohol dehydrogenase-like predicted oxidoreductase
MLEAKVAEGKIRFYGTATWNGYRRPPQSREHLGLETIAGLARDVGGDAHHFRFVQAPLNLQMPEAFTERTQPRNGRAATLLEAAADLGITVVASASLMQASLAQGLPPVVGECLAGLETDAERAIQFTRSTPGLSVALVGMSQAAHVEANLRLAAAAPASTEQYHRLFTRS